MIHTTKAACRVLGRDRKQQADDIATGHCGHVPLAIASLRYWATDDLAAELFFMEQRIDGHSVKMAGKLATWLRSGMMDHPEADQLTLVSLENGSRLAMPTRALDLSTGYNSGSPIRQSLMIDVKNLRARVKRLTEADAQLVRAGDE